MQLVLKMSQTIHILASYNENENSTIEIEGSYEPPQTPWVRAFIMWFHIK